MWTLSSFLGCASIAQCIEPQSPPQLSLVNRIFVDQLGGGHTSDQMRDMIVAALQKSGLFVITENPDRADATLRGSSDDKIYTEEHNLSESLGLRSNGGSGSGTSSSMSGTHPPTKQRELASPIARTATLRSGVTKPRLRFTWLTSTAT